MTAVYLFAAIVGWPFVLFFLFFGGDSDVDGSFDADADVDLGDVDLDADHGWSVSDFLSVRGVVFFAAFFGGTGLLFDAFGAGPATTLFAAITIGALAVLVNGFAYRFIKQSQSNTEIHDRNLQGSSATVVLPIDDERRGRIAVEFGGHRMYFVARPYRRGGGDFAAGDTVVIVEIERGTALVAAMDPLD